MARTTKKFDLRGQSSLANVVQRRYGMNKKTFIGYKPFKWQLFVHQGIDKYGLKSGHIHCVKAKRQIGKSQIILNELLRQSINKSGIASCCLSPTLNQARKIYKEILKVTEGSGAIEKKNDSLLEIQFCNGSVIYFKSAEQRENLRGYTFHFLCIDEASYISDEIYSIIRPTCDVYQAPILMVSTPKFRMGFFYDTYQRGFLDKYKDKISSYDLTKFDTSALLPNETLEMYREMLPKNMFITEYLGEFLDTESIVFGDFKQCINNKISEYNELYVGIDWASGIGSDYTVVTALNEHNEQVFILAFNNKTATQQIDYIVQSLEVYGKKIKHIVAEVNGVGKPLVDALKTKLNIPIYEFTTNNSNKIELINKLQVNFEQNKIKILDNEQQTAQLSMYEGKINSKGTVTYNAPAGCNDDMCMALMFALYSKNLKNKKGNYKISVL